MASSWSTTPSWSLSTKVDSNASLIPSPSLSIVASSWSLIPSLSVSSLVAEVPKTASALFDNPSPSLSTEVLSALSVPQPKKTIKIKKSINL